MPSHSAGLGSRRTQFDVQSGWAWIQGKQCGGFLRPRARWQCNRPCIPVRACQLSGPVVSYRRGFTAVRLTRVVGERRWKDDTADAASDADEGPALALDGRGAAKDFVRANPAELDHGATLILRLLNVRVASQLGPAIANLRNGEAKPLGMATKHRLSHPNPDRHAQVLEEADQASIWPRLSQWLRVNLRRRWCCVCCGNC